MAERALRILVIGNLPPHVLGGAENQVARLVEAWLHAGMQIEVAGHRIPSGHQVLGGHEVRTFRLRPWAIGGRVGRSIGYMLSVAMLALRRRRAYDVVYCRGLGDGVLSLVALKAVGICCWPVVVCPINARGAGDVEFLRSVPGWRLWSRLVDRHVQAINLINAAIKADLEAIGIRRPPLSRIPNGILVCAAPMRMAVAAERRLIWTGRLERQKGLDLLLAALEPCLHEGGRFRLDLYGEGKLRTALTMQVQTLGLNGHVYFHDAVSPAVVRERLLDSDVFVLPSRYEGMSNSALEAMEASLPVLCTHCGGIDTFIGDEAGWVCEPDSVAALTDTLRRMFRTPDADLLARGSMARRLIEERFAMEHVAAANLDLLEQVAMTSRQRD